MRFLKKVAVITLAVLLLAMPVAYAVDVPASNMTDIEAAFLAFEKAIFEQLVKDGYVSQQSADEEISVMQQLLEESADDFIYQLILEGALPFLEPLKGQAWKESWSKPSDGLRK